MKTIEIVLYSFSELSEEAKQTAHENSLQHFDNFWADENRQTLEAFEELFPIKISDWSYGGRGEGVAFYFECDDNIEELKGQRLATYVWNNYKTSLFKGKYYGDANVKKIIRHKRIKGKDHKNGNFTNAYHSAIKLETDCVLTGYYMDNIILGPVYDFLNKPNESDFKELLSDCFGEWVKGCNEDCEDQMSIERFSDNCEANEWTFEEDGTMRND